ncbi:MAG TPA: AAA family ATPase [Rickettsiales bacterium]|nr:AAA family ATPase [Rickettsiales bacterium]
MLEPYNNNKLLTLTKIRDNILNDFFDNKLHHSIMFVGNKGLGKATLAYHIANKILDDETSLKKNKTTSLFGEEINSDDLDINNPTFNLIKNKKHPDLLVIEKEVDSKTSKLDKEIKVASARKIIDFMSLAPFISKNKVIIIDAIDEMNISAQNAILKSLEEPNKNTYIFLICHNINNILDTINSRCKKINIQKHGFDDWKNIFKNSYIEEFKKLNEEKLLELYNLSNSSLSSAIDIIENDGLFLYNYIENTLSQKSLNIEELHNLATKLNDNEKLFLLFKDFILLFLYKVLQYFSINQIDEVFKTKNLEFLLKNNEGSIIEKIKFTKNILRDIEIYNLNKKHAVIVLFNKLFTF